MYQRPGARPNPYKPMFGAKDAIACLSRQINDVYARAFIKNLLLMCSYAEGSRLSQDRCVQIESCLPAHLGNLEDKYGPFAEGATGDDEGTDNNTHPNHNVSDLHPFTIYTLTVAWRPNPQKTCFAGSNHFSGSNHPITTSGK
ncbi:hypothetical protein BGZ97_000762 [Linnemannia gamsii]|uniref:Uncharacterized protein n=1 Tax=Linnemannia gamsii TaxID=64522 RepID=A0A9P6R1T6_9FUNG|nr:hypothetical protein BGZ97_000762 [Linnemannia gamsii]